VLKMETCISSVQNIRASFCPLLSLEKGEFIVTGSGDSNVYFYDLARPKNSCVNKLQGTRLSSNGSSLESRGKFARLIRFRRYSYCMETSKN
uniref:Uncharacterized protein n=1 Tax=Aegilops tauschii subsp. strangulata TaxID=200361 RepID=A0A453FNJ0_AEGTS